MEWNGRREEIEIRRYRPRRNGKKQRKRKVHRGKNTVRSDKSR